jgi:hypothetical protein
VELTFVRRSRDAALKTLVIQSYRGTDVPEWIARCLESVRSWAASQAFDYQLAGDDSFALCGEDYLARVDGNVRSITNLSRLVLVQRAHAAGYDRAIWLDADIFVFAPEQFRIDLTSRYAFARETWIARRGGDEWFAQAGVNNSVFVCTAGEPDLAFLIGAIRHIALHRPIRSNYQVGGDVIKGLRASLAFQVLDNVGMFSADVVAALARRDEPVLHALARFHATPIQAANLCAGSHYEPPCTEADALAAIEILSRTRGDVVNAWVAEGALQAQTYPGFTRFALSAT